MITNILVKINNGILKNIELNDKANIDILLKKININYKDVLVIYNCKILDKSYKISNINSNDIIFINFKIKGGIIGTIVNLLNSVYNFLKKLVDLIEIIFDLIKNLFEMIPTVFKPDKLIDDVIYGLVTAINGVFKTLIDSLDLDSLRGKKKDETGKGAFGVTSESKHVCVAPTMINLIILVLCPPLQLFLYKGMKGIILVIICALLTYYCYYFPGLIFAALHVLC